MVLLTELLQWWNLLFVLPFSLGLLLIGMQLLGALGGEGPDHDTDVDADADAEVDIDADSDVEVDANADADVDADQEIETEHDADQEVDSESDLNIAQTILSFLGVGKVPLSLLIICFCITWGVAGYVSNKMFSHALPPALYVWVSLAIATVTSLVSVRVTSGVLARLIPNFVTDVVAREQLVGSQATVALPIGLSAGTAHLYDEHGGFHEIRCIAAPGEEISSGMKVSLLNYNQKEHVYVVCALPKQLTSQQQGG